MHKDDSIPALIGPHSQSKSWVASPGNGHLGERYLTLFIAGREFGIELAKVRQVTFMSEKSLSSHPYNLVRGGMRLGNSDAPIVDLRSKLGSRSVAETQQVYVVVVQTGARQMGIVVDKLPRIQCIPSETIEVVPTAAVGTRSGLFAIGRSENGINFLQSLNRLLLDLVSEHERLSPNAAPDRDVAPPQTDLDPVTGAAFPTLEPSLRHLQQTTEAEAENIELPALISVSGIPESDAGG